jgi:hypothetical protein
VSVTHIATTRPPLHNQSAENTLDIIPNRGIIERNNKNMKIDMYHGNIQQKIQK